MFGTVGKQMLQAFYIKYIIFLGIEWCLVEFRSQSPKALCLPFLRLGKPGNHMTPLFESPYLHVEGTWW